MLVTQSPLNNIFFIHDVPRDWNTNIGGAKKRRAQSLFAYIHKRSLYLSGFRCLIL